jgi:predicted metalloendopeptidase
MDPTSLQRYYQSVNITPSTFFENTLSMSSLSVSLQWSSLGKPVDRNEWGMTVPTVNAYYNPPGNEIVFPAGIMQFPFQAMNSHMPSILPAVTMIKTGTTPTGGPTALLKASKNAQNVS